MKTWAKVLSVILAVLVLMCIAGGFWLFNSDAGKKILGFGGDVTKLGKSAKSTEQLEKKIPFKVPADGVVPEERLKVYIAVCTQMKPQVEPFNKWVREHEGQKGDFWDATEAIKLISSLIATMHDALEKNGMNPREFSWIQAQMRMAARNVAGARATTTESQMLQTLKDQAAKPGLSSTEKQALLDKIADFEKQIQGQAERAATPNEILYAKYADQLKACDLGEFAGEFAGESGRREERHARKDSPEKPPAEAKE